MRAVLATALIAAAGILPAPALAHGFAVRYQLPLPLGYYLSAAAMAVALSFAAFALFARAPAARLFVTQLVISPPPGFWLGGLFGALGVGLFVLVLATGLFGVQSPLHNLAPAFVWILWWVGLAYVCVLFGDLWALVNPWATLAFWVERLCRRRLGVWRYPERLDLWPAVGLFLMFAWLELIWPGRERPAALAAAIIGYSAITFAGMAAFGRDIWLRRGEAFSIASALLARFAPIARAANGDSLVLRPYALGLAEKGPQSPAMTAFVLTMLATVSFDGLLATPAWAGLKAMIFATPALAPALFALERLTGDVHGTLATVALIGLPLLFAAVYLGVAALVARLDASIGRAGSGAPGAVLIARHFVMSLVPIAIAYHLAHYLSFLMIAGQVLIALISDPFGFGWDLFGTAGRRLDVGVINARVVWYVAISAIVAGHMIAVYLAHLAALRLFGERRRANLSQIPMVALMVVYTTLSLWILAQPVVAD